MIITKNTTYFDLYNAGEENTASEFHKIHKDFRLEWVSTDGWRGHMEAKATKKSKYQKITDRFLRDNDQLAGWLTDAWSDAPQGTQESDIEKALNSYVMGDFTELVIIFLPTSNVFSTCYEIFVR